MVFLITVDALTMLCVVTGSVAAYRELQGQGRHRPGQRRRLFASLAAAALLLLPTLVEFTTSGAHRLGADFLPDGCFAAGATMALGLYWSELRQRAARGNTGFWAIGESVLAMLASLYVLFAVADHLWFFTATDGQAGVVDAAWLARHDPGHRQCHQGFVLVAGVGTGTVTLRCPKPGAAVFAAGSSTPFVPWPGYTEATSAPAAQAIERMRNNAQYLGGTAKHGS